MIFFDAGLINIMLNWLRIPSTQYIILYAVAYRLNKTYMWGNFMRIIGAWCGSKKVDETVLISVAHFKGLYCPRFGAEKVEQWFCTTYNPPIILPSYGCINTSIRHCFSPFLPPIKAYHNIYRIFVAMAESERLCKHSDTVDLFVPTVLQQCRAMSNMWWCEQWWFDYVLWMLWVCQIPVLSWFFVLRCLQILR